LANFIEVLTDAIKKGGAFFIIGNKVIDFPDVAPAYRQYAKAVSKSVNGLTDIEKQQAVLNMILSEADVE